MGIRPKPLTERNQDVYDLHDQGVSYREIMKKHDISKSRVYAILKAKKSRN